MQILQILSFILFLTVIPVLPGYLLTGQDESGPYALPKMWCVGFTVLLAVLHWPAVILILLHGSLSALTVIYVAVTALLIAGAFIKMARRRENPFSSWRAIFKGITFPEVLTAAAVFGHAAVTALMMHVDDDDYAFVANATTSLDTDTLLKFIGGSGKVLVKFNMDGIDRLVSSPHFTFYAVLSKLFGTRPAALAHTYLPPVFTLLFFTAFLLAGYELFAGDRRKTGIFTAFVFVISMSSYYSTRTAGTFMMVRSWQGKAQVTGLILPLILWLYLGIVRSGKMTGRHMLLLAVLLLASCLMTSMGAMLCAVSAVFLAAVTSFVLKNCEPFLRSLPPLILPMMTAGVYLMVR